MLTYDYVPQSIFLFFFFWLNWQSAFLLHRCTLVISLSFLLIKIYWNRMCNQPLLLPSCTRSSNTAHKTLSLRLSFTFTRIYIHFYFLLWLATPLPAAVVTHVPFSNTFIAFITLVVYLANTHTHTNSLCVSLSCLLSYSFI